MPARGRLEYAAPWIDHEVRAPYQADRLRNDRDFGWYLRAVPVDETLELAFADAPFLCGTLLLAMDVHRLHDLPTNRFDQRDEVCQALPNVMSSYDCVDLHPDA